MRILLCIYSYNPKIKTKPGRLIKKKHQKQEIYLQIADNKKKKNMKTD